MRPATGDRDRLDPDRPRCGPGRRGAGPALAAVVLAMLSIAMPSDARAAAARMTVTGRVLDPSGKPVPGADVMVIVRSKMSDRPMPDQVIGPTTAHAGRCDASGRFAIELPRTSSARHDGLVVTARAHGFGIGWAELDPDADPPAADIALRTEQVVRGRLIDVQGRPAPGAAVRTMAVLLADRGDVVEWHFHPDYARHPRRDPAAWPLPAISDRDGAFALGGLGPGLRALIEVDDPRFEAAPTALQVDDGNTRRDGFPLAVIKVEPGPDAKPITIGAQPAQTITGRVTYADTGRPVPHAPVAVSLQYRADGEGRFRAKVPVGGRGVVMAQAPDGAPYLIASKGFECPRGAPELSVDLALTRGVVIRGRVTEEGSGRPIAGAVVRFVPDLAPEVDSQDLSLAVATGPDGAYRAAAPPGRGCLVVQGPDDDYVLREFGGYRPDGARPGGLRLHAHAYRTVELRPGDPDHVVDFTLRRGSAIHGRIVDPDGQPVRDASIFSRVVLQSRPTGGWKIWNVVYDRGRGHVHDGRFAQHGLDADVEVPAYFLKPERRLGATVRFSGRSAASGPVTVRLEPCGTARARLVGPDGKPLDQFRSSFLISMVVTPGPPFRRDPPKDGPLFADEVPLFQVDSDSHPFDLRSDAQGRVAFSVLIPGASYRILDHTAAVRGSGPEVRKEFTVKSGEMLDLGDILIAKPPPRIEPRDLPATPPPPLPGRNRG